MCQLALINCPMAYETLWLLFKAECCPWLASHDIGLREEPQAFQPSSYVVCIVRQKCRYIPVSGQILHTAICQRLRWAGESQAASRLSRNQAKFNKI
jgi:hypothetical protein